MFTFSSIKELINTLNWSKELLTEMFEKRKSFAYKYEHAVEVIEESRLDALIELEVIRRNGPLLEIDDQFLQFFEQILEVNEEINTATVHENIRILKQHINHYLQENNGNRKYSYLKAVKSVLRKIGMMTLRNIVDLNRNIENTFKTEPTYKIKISKLKGYDQKRQDINVLISQTQQLLDGEEITFFKIAPDEEFSRITNQLRLQLNEAHHNLIETQKQIIDFLNQIKYQSRILEKIRQVKYLKDQFELKERTNFMTVIADCHDLFFSPQRSGRMKLSLDLLQDDQVYPILLKASQKRKSGVKLIRPIAANISAEYLAAETAYEVFLDPEEIKNSFFASGDHLFNFLRHYQYPKEVTFEEMATLYCQLISLYEDEFILRDTYGEYEGLEYAVVYPK
ncbi:MAG: hypothetical protein DRH07_08360 [Deltaproteobacteria bacterium]|nr:MAG: hypothetical protein DRH07_08360 [Deltaproteobacteria bacterium]